ncbi:MAG TPA: sigma-70 family RNA polymerase sigma factor [Bacteroidetes bacterium]|nr:sigma-70 family RNA polymerase sigma factor [Bacteroidota bacterium]
MAPIPSPEVTHLLHAHRDGQPGAMDQLLPLVYAELRRIASRHLGGGRGPETLQTTALVHEAYLRLAGSPADVADRAHFFAVASTAMRHVLVDYARRRHALKRGGGAHATTLSGKALALDARADEVLALDDALGRLAVLDERLAKVVEMRFFGGMDVEEVAQALGVSDRTVKRDWRKARAFLEVELAE